MTRSSSEQLIFDGDCGFCTMTSKWIDERVAAQVVPWQNIELEAVGLTVDDVTNAAFWIDHEGNSHRGELAIAKALQAAGLPWSIIGRSIETLPGRWLARIAYSWVAANRYRLPGSTGACRVR